MPFCTVVPSRGATPLLLAGVDPLLLTGVDPLYPLQVCLGLVQAVPRASLESHVRTSSLLSRASQLEEEAIVVSGIAVQNSSNLIVLTPSFPLFDVKTTLQCYSPARSHYLTLRQV